MKQLIKQNLKTLIAVLLGAVAGYLYWAYVGCTSGACPITSSPWMSTLWGGLIGFSLFPLRIQKCGASGKQQLYKDVIKKYERK